MRILNLMGAAALAALMMTGATASASAQPMDGMGRHHMERRMMHHDRMMRHHERRMMRHRMMRHRMQRRMHSM